MTLSRTIYVQFLESNVFLFYLFTSLGVFLVTTKKRVCSHWMRLQREHIFMNSTVPRSEAKWVSEPVNKAQQSKGGVAGDREAKMIEPFEVIDNENYFLSKAARQGLDMMKQW